MVLLLKRYYQYIKAKKYPAQASRILRILLTPYRRHILDDKLNFRSRVHPQPEVKILSTQNGWKIIQIENLCFYWPDIYTIGELASLYIDTFEPYKYNPHAYESGEVCIQPGSWVIDAGACEGFFTFYALSRGASVLMIEPVSKLAEALSHTFKNEIKHGKVRLLHGAIGDKTGAVDLSIPSGGPIVASIDPTWTVDKDWQLYKPDAFSITKERVRVYRLDDILEGGVIPTVDFIKMDIENTEVGAVRGAEKVLRNLKPKLSIAVYHEYLNAILIRSYLLRIQPHYKVKYRGLFYRSSFGPPRPYMLYAE